MKLFRPVFCSLLFQVLFFGFICAQDWPNLARYREANEKLKSDPGKKIRVVFMGNSITDFWIRQSPDFFENNRFVDRGTKVHGRTGESE